MSRLATRSQFARWLAVPAAVNALLLSVAQPAHASEPAGTGLNIDTMLGTGTNQLLWSGSYSCTGTSPVTLDLIASDTEGGGLNDVNTFSSESCPATGAPISGVVNAVDGTWRSPTLWEASLYADGIHSADTDGDVVNNNDDEITVDSDTVNPNGTITVGGTLRCSVNGGTETLSITLTQAAGTTDNTATEIFPETCPASAGSPVGWTRTGWPSGWITGSEVVGTGSATGGGWGGGWGWRRRWSWGG
ncbi:hypothetical protein GCM10022403_045530 [Streptomyces coacervatus]|uniref:Ig-like domain-containing protein n=1 Tax=Streptomyces coacervatus TaxID=647381 RepID=A0ABP7HX09_9ACTN|nr:hypothetical protein [Streptomyces coacervatus]MDF2269551.1 hypothetical protein [Streptomyces coacervatus]